MNPLDSILENNGVVILDGALATELEKRGADLDHELWSAKLLQENPQAIGDLHYDYFCAGADVVITASYQASIEGFERFGLSASEAGSLIQKSVTIAVDARTRYLGTQADDESHPKPLVAASIGPYGAILHDGSEYTGNYQMTRQALKDFHRPRMALLNATEADLFALETIPSLREAEALLELLGEFPERKAWLSFSCRNETQVCHGEAFADCVALATENEQIIAVGINCSPPQIVLPLLQSAQGTYLPLLAYPNSGEVWVSSDNSWVPARAGQCPSKLMQLPDLAEEWYMAGARLIGGCCRTSIEDIRDLRKRLRESRKIQSWAKRGESHNRA